MSNVGKWVIWQRLGSNFYEYGQVARESDKQVTTTNRRHVTPHAIIAVVDYEEEAAGRVQAAHCAIGDGLSHADKIVRGAAT